MSPRSARRLSCRVPRLACLLAALAGTASAAEPAGPGPCLAGVSLGVYPCDGVDLLAFLNLADLRPDAARGSSLWGFADRDDGREYALIGLNTGTTVVDLTDPIRPRVVSSIAGPSSSWREVKVYQRFDAEAGRYRALAYVTAEAEYGVQILDLTDLPDRVVELPPYTGISTAHTLFLANVDNGTGSANVPGVPPVLYINGSGGCGLVALGLADPANPAFLACHDVTYAHDIYATVLSGERARRQCAPGHDPCEVVFNFAGDVPGPDLRVIDFTDKSNPVEIGSLDYPRHGYAHSGFGTADDRFLFLQDEFDEGFLGLNTNVRTIDVSDVRAPAMVGGWLGPNRAVDHNGHTLGHHYYMSNYTRGLTILDVTDPVAPAGLAFFDTYPSGDPPTFDGAWAVYPYLPSGTLLVSSINDPGGLFVLKEQAANPDLAYLVIARHRAADGTLQVAATSSRAPGCALTAVGFGLLSYDAPRGVYIGTFPAPAAPATVTVTSSCGGTDTHGVPYPL